MDLNSQKLLHKDKLQNNNNGEAEDRITKLPDSLLHYILSFLDTMCVARTSVLSKRWNYIWTSIPTLVFEFYDRSRTPSLRKINKFMDFVDRTLHLHDIGSTIKRFSFESNSNMNASRVHSWIENLTRRNVEEIYLSLYQDEPFSIPSSLFICASLTKLELNVGHSIHFPKNISFPKLKSLTLTGVQFKDCFWNEQLFPNCTVLEELCLESCTWFGMKKFSILAPTLKVLQIENDLLTEDGLRDCNLKIHAPSLVNLKYWGSVAKDFDLSRFVTLDNAEVDFHEDESIREERINKGAAVSKFLRALSHVRCLSIFIGTVQVISVAYDFAKHLPTFHNLHELNLNLLNGSTTDKLIFALLKAAPNLKWLEFGEAVLLSIYDEIEIGEAENLLPHLEAVSFWQFSGEARELRWAELILKNAKSLQTMTFGYGTRYSNAKSKEVLMSELPSLPRASEKCVFQFV